MMASKAQIKIMRMGLGGKLIACKRSGCGHGKSDHKQKRSKEKHWKGECTWDRCDCQGYISPMKEGEEI